MIQIRRRRKAGACSGDVPPGRAYSAGSLVWRHLGALLRTGVGSSQAEELAESVGFDRQPPDLLGWRPAAWMPGTDAIAGAEVRVHCAGQQGVED
ncbi:MAG TPA: hypothetical protein VK631_21410, partial [Solirubrobacteraceae bacterium]|nr:hypothetical protein [Solirubrobacteraceae bacterium]